ncbi:gluconate 2-dehydrogenase subunit 3 family protein [Nocardioides albidus]|uniref:Gluconate 2-dehydrogenase subunit 3 family protein n=1 Tax=Nocardioides albidus TaxID=1517589 RepID=A0A5C4WJD3_9ACTN|nr:gluconate 2-dehydrogenase subunit 3 family protein [Nocardioides albidus]TNM48294.1 gluconate 2-dehydrogenase subunit 3 family protein [Nocardioides albidus]
MLDPTARDRLAVLADVLIPGSGDFPSASAAGVPTDLIDRALGFRPDLVPAFGRALELADGLDAEAALDLISTGHIAEFEALSTLVSGAYLQSPQVQQALNYRPAPRQANDDIDSYVDLLEVVVDRGFDIHGADLS